MMRASGLISCIVPVYNGERYLSEALDSILGQTYRPLQVIVADDGSEDGTAGIVAGYGGRVEYHRQPTAGPAATRNLGLSAAHGALVAFLDPDDLWHLEKLARQVARFQARPELDLCITHARNFWAPELREEEERFRNHARAQAVPGFSTITLLARRSLFDTVGQFNVALQHGDNLEWFVRATEQGAVLELLPDVLVSRRLHGANSSRRNASAFRAECLAIVKASLDRRRCQVRG